MFNTSDAQTVCTQLYTKIKYFKSVLLKICSIFDFEHSVAYKCNVFVCVCVCFGLCVCVSMAVGVCLCACDIFVIVFFCMGVFNVT